MKNKNLVFGLGRKFFYDNRPSKSLEILDNKEIVYDSSLKTYPYIVQAFVQKRRMCRWEIPPKIYILPNVKSVENYVKFQRLPKFSYEFLKNEVNKENINSEYIVSNMIEPVYYELLTEYLKKIVIMGAVTKINENNEYSMTKKKIMDLWDIFFNGEKMSVFELALEKTYLEKKMIKWGNYRNKGLSRYKSIWTVTNERTLQYLVNKIAKDSDLYDDFRPIFHPLETIKTHQSFVEFAFLSGYGKIRRFFNYLSFIPYLRVSKKLSYITARHLFKRIRSYCACSEFLRALDIPEDFQITQNLINVHIWLLTSRLKNSKNSVSEYIAEELILLNQLYLGEEASRTFLKKSSDLHRDMIFYFRNTRIFLTKQFFEEMNGSNPLKKLDALIWSFVFFEKVPRYSDEVYFIADYIDKHVKILKKTSIEKIENGEFEFDIYRSEIDFKEKMIKLNGYLTPEEFAEEQKSERKIKKYHYNYKEI